MDVSVLSPIALICMGALGAAFFITIPLLPYLLAVRRTDLLRERIFEVVRGVSSGLILFDQKDRMIYADDYARNCASFLAQSDMKRIAFEECLDYLAIQAQRAALQLGSEVVQCVQKASGRFKEVILRSDGGYAVAEAVRCDDGGWAFVFSAFDNLYALSGPIQKTKMQSMVSMAAGIAHHYNNLLSIIEGHMRILLKDQGFASNSHVNKIREAAMRAADFNMQLMTFCALPVDLNGVVDLASLISDPSSSFYKNVPEGIKLRTEINVKHGYVQSYAQSLNSVFAVLIDNAVQAIPDRGHITVCLDLVRASGKDYLRARVSDDGHGMTASVLGRIFDPYYSTHEVGGGLGLSVAHGLVEQHGGFITVESKPWLGSVFDVYLPQSAQVSNKKVSGNVLRPDSIKLHGYTILVVDDEESILDIISSMLRDTGATVLTANHPNEALLIQDEYEGTIDLMLSDIVMPEMNGVQLAQMMRASGAEMKVVFMSAFPGRGRSAMVALPPDIDFIAKPFDYGGLVVCLYKNLSQVHALMQNNDNQSHNRQQSMKEVAGV